MDLGMLSLFEDGLRRFNRERCSPLQLVESAKAGHGTRHWQEMAALGWFDLGVAEEGLPEILPLLSIYRAAGEGLWREPIDCVFGESAVIVGSIGDRSLRRRFSEGLASGQQPLAYAARERGGEWSPARPATCAQSIAGGLVLSGSKVAVVEDSACTGYLVTASDADSGRRSCYQVERGARGLEIVRYPTVEGRHLADLHLDRTPALRVCDSPDWQLLEAWGSLLAAAESVGIMRGANQDTLAYLRQRRQFGRPLIDFQVLQHRLAEMLMLERETDALLRDLADDLDEDRSVDPRGLLALGAQASRALRHVTREAVQMHGGMGVTQECRVSHYYRRALTLDSRCGGEAWALARLAAA